MDTHRLTAFWPLQHLHAPRWRRVLRRLRAAWMRAGMTSEERYLAGACDAHDLERRQRALETGFASPGQRPWV